MARRVISTTSVPCPIPTGYYSFDLGAWHIVSLNSKSAVTSPAVVPDRPIRVAEDGSRGERGRLHARHQHHPRYDWRPFQKWIDDEGQISNSGSETDPYIDLWDLMDASGVDVLLAGHNHIYQRWAPRTATEFATRTRRHAVHCRDGRAFALPVRAEAPAREPRRDPEQSVRSAADDAARHELRVPVGSVSPETRPSATPERAAASSGHPRCRSARTGAAVATLSPCVAPRSDRWPDWLLATARIVARRSGPRRRGSILARRRRAIDAGDLRAPLPGLRGAAPADHGDLLLLGPRDALAVRAVSLSRMPASRLPTFASLVRASGSILLDLRGELRAWSGRVWHERTPEGHIGTERVQGPCPRCRSRSASRTPLATSACGTERRSARPDDRRPGDDRHQGRGRLLSGVSQSRRAIASSGQTCRRWISGVA